MSRLKIYYSPSEQKLNLYTTGSQWMYKDGTEYKGAYHTYSTGEVYTMAKYIGGKSEPLVKFEKTDNTNYVYKQLKPNIKVKFKTPIPYNVTIKNENIQSGILIRYFLKKVNSENIIEISSKQYDEWKTNDIDKNLHQTVRIFWKITGNKYDTVINGTKQLGVISKNRNQIINAATKIPGIENILTNPLQYYTDTDFTDVLDINGLDS